MERLGNFANKIKTKSVIMLFIFVLVFMQYFNYGNIKELMEVSEKSDIKAAQESVPDGYVGIYTVDDLQILNGSNFKTKYILMNDIDLDGKEFSVIDSFNGTFDGNYHKISNLKIESQNQYVGMFGRLYGTVQNLILENINVKGDFNGTSYIGGLAGWSNPQLEAIQNVHIIGNSNIEASTNTTYSYLGGLIGSISGGTISECSTVGKVNTMASGGGFVGGLLGSASAVLNNCNSNAEVINNSNVGVYLGGLTGSLRGLAEI